MVTGLKHVIQSESNRRVIMIGPTMVAVVDDDSSVLEAVGNLLEAGGHGVARFESAETFLERAATTKFDCLVSDIGLPRMNGFELQLEVGLRAPQLPVILITGRDEYGSSAVPAFNNRGLFRKPFDAGQLLAAIAAAIKTAAV